MAVREGAWDCPFCGATRNRGPEKFCGGCGSPRGPEVKFYLPEDARVVDDAHELEKATSGPNWTCEFCSGDNAGWNKFCTGCGSGREAGVARDVVTHRGQAPSSAEEAARSSAAGRSPLPETSPQTDPPRPARRKACGLCLGGCGLLLVLLALLAGFLSCSHSEKLDLVSAHWDRAISIEKQVTVREQAWSDQVPSGARELSRNREVRSHRQVQIGSETRTRTVQREVQDGTEQVKVGSRDLGNGYFEDVYEDRPIFRTVQEEETWQEPVYRQEPVYATRVTYEVERWKEVRQARASGEDNRPEWPETNLARGEREGPRTEKYVLKLRGRDGKLRQHEVQDAATFQAFQVGQTCPARLNRLGVITELKP